MNEPTSHSECHCAMRARSGRCARPTWVTIALETQTEPFESM